MENYEKAERNQEKIRKNAINWILAEMENYEKQEEIKTKIKKNAKLNLYQEIR